MKAAPWLWALAFTLLLIGGSTWLHPMELADFNSEIDGFVASSETLRRFGLPMDPFRPLLYPILVAALSSAMKPFAAARLLSNLAAGGFVLTGFFLAERALDRRAAWMVMASLALNPHVLLHGQLATSDMTFSAFAVLTLYLAVRLAERLTPIAALGLAAALAATAFTRYQAAALGPAVVWAFLCHTEIPWRRRVAWLFGLGAATAILLIPHFTLNTLQFGDPFFNMNWGNLALKLYGNGDWTYLERVPFHGWTGVIAAGPGTFLRATVMEFAGLFPHSFAYLLGGDVTGIIFVVLALFGLLRAHARDGLAPSIHATLVLFTAATLLGVCATFYAYPRLLIVLLPVLLIYGLVALRALVASPGAQAAIMFGLTAALVRVDFDTLTELHDRAPGEEVAVAERLVDKAGPGAVVASTYYALRWRISNPVVYVPDAADSKAASHFYDTLARQLLKDQVDYLVVGRDSIRARPTSLLEVAAVPPFLVAVDQADGAIAYRIDRSAIPSEATRRCTPAVDADPDLLDDFEDLDLWITCAADRDGEWQAYGDGTGLVDLKLLAGEASAELHLNATGFAGWGAGAHTAIRGLGEGPLSTYDATAYRAVRFRARADAPVDLQVRLSDKWTEPDSHLCQTLGSCYDHHVVTVHVDAEWRTFEVAFADGRQAGWGQASPGPDGVGQTADDGAFDRAYLTGISFQVASPDFHLVLDDVGFVRVGG